MKLVELEFNNEQDYEIAREIMYEVAEAHPTPKPKPSYVVPAIGEQIDELKNRLAERGIAYHQAYEADIDHLLEQAQ